LPAEPVVTTEPAVTVEPTETTEATETTAAPTTAVPTTEPAPPVASEALCGRLAEGAEVAGAPTGSDENATLLLDCMRLLTGGEDAEQLADLQLIFLIDFAGHADAARVRTELAANYGACARLEAVRVLHERTEGSTLYVDTLFTCAGFADFVGDVDSAIGYYEQLRSLGVQGEQATRAEAGLARNLIARARAQGADPLLDIARIGPSGSRLAQLSFSNDTAYVQTLVLSGPEGRIVVIDASPTSSTYLTPPSSCRDDVPSVTLDLTPGTYDVMLSDAVVDAEVATWTLEAGAAYGWCSYYVRAF
jgi:hypothetical protein